MALQAEVISIGDELTSGQRLDTNSQWLSERLGELGIRVMFHSTVADDLAANVQVFRQAVERADVVVATGGLGPTADDLTREALAAVAGVDLLQDTSALEHIRQLFARRQRPMPERNVVQALFPAGSRVIPNPQGTAPGIDLTIARQAGTGSGRVFALPGVPAEMHEMWAATVGPALAALSDGRRIKHFRLKCFGVGESDLEARLPDLIRRGREPQVGITVSEATITLRITASGASDEECLAAMQPTIATIHECLGSLVYGAEEDELTDCVARLLAQRGQSLAVAEWATAGWIAEQWGRCGDANDGFRGGWTLHNATAVDHVLKNATAQPTDSHAPSQTSPAEVAQQLAELCRRQFGADYGLAVGQITSSAVEAPTVWLALATAQGSEARSVPYTGHSAILRPLTAKRALNWLRLRLLGVE